MRAQPFRAGSHLACLNLILLFICATSVNATFWTVTSYYQYSLSVTSVRTRGYTYTSIETVKPGVTPTASPVSASTHVIQDDDITIVWAYLPPDSVPEEDLQTTYSYNTDYLHVQTVFAEVVTFTAPASCPTPFTVVTVQPVYVPYQVSDQLEANLDRDVCICRSDAGHVYNRVPCPKRAPELDDNKLHLQHLHRQLPESNRNRRGVLGSADDWIQKRRRGFRRGFRQHDVHMLLGNGLHDLRHLGDRGRHHHPYHLPAGLAGVVALVSTADAGQVSAARRYGLLVPHLSVGDLLYAVLQGEGPSRSSSLARAVEQDGGVD